MSGMMHEPQTTTDDVMSVDMPFLDAFRRGGGDEMNRLREQAAVDTSDVEIQPEVEGSSTPEHDGAEAQRTAGQHGGGSGAQPAQPVSTEDVGPSSVDELVAEAAIDDEVEIAPETLTLEHDSGEHEDIPVSLQHTDHQDAIQSASSERGGGAAADDAGAVLPQSGFRIVGVQRQPHIKSLPDSIVTVLRRQLQAAAVRELGVTPAAAQEFSERLSQGTLVTAFLLAQLDLRIDADPATTRAAELFATRDPLLGSVASRLARMEAREREQDKMMAGLRALVTEVRETGAVVEQLVAYSVTDREANFLRGDHDIHAAPFTHREVLSVRNRARELTKKQERLEREREGRPIR